MRSLPTGRRDRVVEVPGILLATLICLAGAVGCGGARNPGSSGTSLASGVGTQRPGGGEDPVSAFRSLRDALVARDWAAVWENAPPSWRTRLETNLEETLASMRFEREERRQRGTLTEADDSGRSLLARNIGATDKDLLILLR